MRGFLGELVPTAVRGVGYAFLHCVHVDSSLLASQYYSVRSDDKPLSLKWRAAGHLSCLLRKVPPTQPFVSVFVQSRCYLPSSAGCDIVLLSIASRRYFP